MCPRPLPGTPRLCAPGEGGQEAARSGPGAIPGTRGQGHGSHQGPQGGGEEVPVLPGPRREQTSACPDWEREGARRLDGGGGGLRVGRGWRKAEEPASFCKGQNFVAGLLFSFMG